MAPAQIGETEMPSFTFTHATVAAITVQAAGERQAMHALAGASRARLTAHYAAKGRLLNTVDARLADDGAWTCTQTGNRFALVCRTVAAPTHRFETEHYEAGTRNAFPGIRGW